MTGGLFRIAVLFAAALVAQPAFAQEAYVGTSFHGVDTPFTLEAGERGSDLQFGYRSAPLAALESVGEPSTYVHGQVSLNGETSLVAIGLSWKFGDKLYVRPGIGLALHNDKIKEFRRNGKRLDLGSRILFEPEIAAGVKLNERVAAEISWVHVSNATLLSGQNPGMDFIGARLVFKLR